MFLIIAYTDIRIRWLHFCLFYSVAFSARRPTALLLTAVLSVRPSVRHIRDPRQNGLGYPNAICTTR